MHILKINSVCAIMRVYEYAHFVNYSLCAIMRINVHVQWPLPCHMTTVSHHIVTQFLLGLCDSWEEVVLQGWS